MFKTTDLMKNKSQGPCYAACFLFLTQLQLEKKPTWDFPEIWNKINLEFSKNASQATSEITTGHLACVTQVMCNCYPAKKWYLLDSNTQLLIAW